MAEPIISEEWRPVVGLEGWYEVSNHGRVRSVDRTIMQTRRSGRTRPWRYVGKTLSISPSGRTGYVAVHLMCGGIRRNGKVHKLVAAAFLGHCPAGCEINHIDGDKTNNVPSNLEYVSHNANMVHAAKNGLMPDVSGTKNPRVRLTEREVFTIRERFCRGESHQTLASEYGIGATTVWHIVTGKNWSHVGGPLLHDRVGGRKLRSR